MVRYTHEVCWVDEINYLLPWWVCVNWFSCFLGDNIATKLHVTLYLVRTIFPSVRSFVRSYENLPACSFQHTWCLALSLLFRRPPQQLIILTKNFQKDAYKEKGGVSQRLTCLVHGVSTTFSKQLHSLIWPIPRSTKMNVLVQGKHFFSVLKQEHLLKNTNQVKRMSWYILMYNCY